MLKIEITSNFLNILSEKFLTAPKIRFFFEGKAYIHKNLFNKQKKSISPPFVGKAFYSRIYNLQFSYYMLCARII